MSKAKDKGRALENLIVKLLTDAGIPSERVPLSGSLSVVHEKFKGDVVIGTIEDRQATIECKFRQSISMQLWDWFDTDDDYLVVKRNHKKPLIMMDMDQFIKLYKNTE